MSGIQLMYNINRKGHCEMSSVHNRLRISDNFKQEKSRRNQTKMRANRMARDSVIARLLMPRICECIWVRLKQHGTYG